MCVCAPECVCQGVGEVALMPGLHPESLAEAEAAVAVVCVYCVCVCAPECVCQGVGKVTPLPGLQSTSLAEAEAAVAVVSV